MLTLNIVLSILCAGVVAVAAPILLLAVLDVVADLYQDTRGDQ